MNSTDTITERDVRGWMYLAHCINPYDAALEKMKTEIPFLDLIPPATGLARSVQRISKFLRVVSDPSMPDERGVMSNDNKLIAIIGYYKPWREWVLYPEPKTIWSTDCLVAIKSQLTWMSSAMTVPYQYLIPANLKTLEFFSAWTDWVDERKHRRQPITKRAAAMQLKKCSQWGPKNATESICRSIENGWTGLFQIAEMEPARKSLLVKQAEELQRLNL